MNEYLAMWPAFVVGMVVGVAVVLLFVRLRSGSANPAKAKREFEEYQAQVETHFEQTSVKFQSMAKQYQDLYEHLAVGAVQLCRTDRAVELLDKPQTAKKAIQSEKASEKTSGEKGAQPQSSTKTASDRNSGKDAKGAAKQAEKHAQSKT